MTRERLGPVCVHVQQEDPGTHEHERRADSPPPGPVIDHYADEGALLRWPSPPLIAPTTRPPSPRPARRQPDDDDEYVPSSPPDEPIVPVARHVSVFDISPRSR